MVNLDEANVEVLAESSRTIILRAHLPDGTSVVIKVPSSEFPSVEDRKAIVYEDDILKKIDSPHVVKSLGIQRFGTKQALILDDFLGLPLGGGDRSFRVEEVIVLAIGIVSALRDIHDTSIIHRDIKPSNILFRPSDLAIQLIDFHLSSELKREHQGALQQEFLEGSLAYISPEQTGRLNRDLDYRSDFYSLGITLYELISGALPFNAEDAMGWVHCHVSLYPDELIEKAPDTPKALCAIVSKLMSKDPDLRYQSTRGLLFDLKKLQSQVAANTDSNFELGTKDISSNFQVPQKLIGRDDEIEQLYEVFHDVTQGKSHWLLVEGRSGIGKSSLVREIQKPIVSTRGEFVSEKFDQLGRNVPYGAFIRAISSLIKGILVGSNAELAHWKEKLQSAVGADGSLVPLIPGLEMVIGQQDTQKELTGAELQLHFRRLIREIIGVFSRPERPLVMFLDDLQWMDSATPDLIIELMRDEDAQNLLLIGAYRDNEVDEMHPLMECIRTVKKNREDAVSSILLSPLTIENVSNIVCTTLRRSERDCKTFSREIYERASGNPFFTNELLEALYQQDALQFSQSKGYWEWEENAFNEILLSDDLVELMVQRIRRLPLLTQEIMTKAAAIGNCFETKTLIAISDLSPNELFLALHPAVMGRVLLPSSGSSYRLDVDSQQKNGAFKFQHDRVQQAAYSLVKSSERQMLHRKIGQILLQGISDESPGVDYLDAVNHLNQGDNSHFSLLDRTDLCDANIQAAKVSEGAAAFGTAADYCTIALDCLTDGEWEAKPKLHFDLLFQRVHCLYFDSRIEEVVPLKDTLISKAQSRLDRAAVYEFLCQFEEYRGNFSEALEFIREGLALLGTTLPKEVPDILSQLNAGIGQIKGQLDSIIVEELPLLPEVTDIEIIMKMKLLTRAVPPAIQIFPPLFLLVEITMFDLVLEHGLTEDCCKNFVDCGIIAGPIIGDYETAYKLGEAAFTTLERFEAEGLRAGVSFVFASFISHWKKPNDCAMSYFSDALRSGLSCGDIQHYSHAMSHRTFRITAIGVPFDEVRAENRRAMLQLKEISSERHYGAISANETILDKLCIGPECIDEYEEDYRFYKKIEQEIGAQWATFWVLFRFAYSDLLLNNYENAWKWIENARTLEAALSGLFYEPQYRLIEVILCCERFQETQEERTVIADIIEKLKIWSQHSPENYARHYHLANAEFGKIMGLGFAEINDSYELAASSISPESLPDLALIRERQARYWIAQGFSRAGRTYLVECCVNYSSWGATRKVRELQKEFPSVFTKAHRTESIKAVLLPQQISMGRGTGGSELDLQSVMKATRAISGEVDSRRLFDRLMDIVAENAGAQLTHLVLLNDEQNPEVVASLNVVTQTRLNDVRSLEKASVSADIVRYVVRCKESLVLADASSSRFSKCQHVETAKVRSALAIPIQNRNRVIGVLYAENNASSHTFTQSHIEVLQVLASQAAVSIENSNMYANLEKKVEVRTRELAGANRKVETMLNGIEQGVFTINQNMEIDPQYSKHLGELFPDRKIANQNVFNVLFRNSNQGPDSIARMEASLAACFGVYTLFAEANAIHLVNAYEIEREDKTLYFEVDWIFISDEDERVEKILVTVRDVSELKELRAAAINISREAEMIQEIIAIGSESFHDFNSTSSRYLEDSLTILQSDGHTDSEQVSALFRNIHTLKANARSQGFRHLVDAVHLLEEDCVIVRDKGVIEQTEISALTDGIDDLTSLLSDYSSVAEQLIQGFGSKKDESRTLVDSILELQKDGDEEPQETLAKIFHMVNGLGSVGLEEIVEKGRKTLPSLAKELGKHTPQFLYESQGIRLTTEAGAVLQDVFVTALRNSLYHGIESPECRQARNKPKRSIIELKSLQKDGGIELRLIDDGQGLALDRLREMLGDETATDEKVAEYIFSAGTTTVSKADTVSGRGVGMDAIRAFVTSLGGSAHLEFTSPAAGGFREFALVLYLPETVLYKDTTIPTKDAAPTVASQTNCN